MKRSVARPSSRSPTCSAMCRKWRRSLDVGGARSAQAARASALSRAMTASRVSPKVTRSRKPRKAVRIASRRRRSWGCTGRDEPPGCRLRECGHLPASSPMRCRNWARAGRTSRWAVPVPARKRSAAAAYQGSVAVDLAGEVRHEEEVEVGEVVGQVLAGEDQVGGQLAVGRRGQALAPRPGHRRRPWTGRPSRYRRSAARSPGHRAGPCRGGSARIRGRGGS